MELIIDLAAGCFIGNQASHVYFCVPPSPERVDSAVKTKLQFPLASLDQIVAAHDDIADLHRPFHLGAHIPYLTIISHMNADASGVATYEHSELEVSQLDLTFDPEQSTIASLPTSISSLMLNGISLDARLLRIIGDLPHSTHLELGLQTVLEVLSALPKLVVHFYYQVAHLEVIPGVLPYIAGTPESNELRTVHFDLIKNEDSRHHEGRSSLHHYQVSIDAIQQSVTRFQAICPDVAVEIDSVLDFITMCRNNGHTHLVAMITLSAGFCCQTNLRRSILPLGRQRPCGASQWSCEPSAKRHSPGSGFGREGGFG